MTPAEGPPVLRLGIEGGEHRVDVDADDVGPEAGHQSQRPDAAAAEVGHPPPAQVVEP